MNAKLGEVKGPNSIFEKSSMSAQVRLDHVVNIHMLKNLKGRVADLLEQTLKMEGETLFCF